MSTPSWRSLPHGQARRLAIPAIASNVAVPLVGLTDTALLGHFSDAVGLGAVGLGSAVIATVFWAFAFLRPGTTSLVGRAFGAGREDDAIRHLQRALALAAALGTLWLALQWLIVPLVVRMEGTNVEEGRRLLAESGLPIINATGILEAAEKAIAAAGGAA